MRGGAPLLWCLWACAARSPGRGEVAVPPAEREQRLGVEGRRLVLELSLAEARGEGLDAALLDRLRAAEPRLGWPDLRAGEQALAAEPARPEDALAFFDEALRREPEMAAAWRGRARALRALGRPTEADAAARRALELAPSPTGWALWVEVGPAAERGARLRAWIAARPEPPSAELLERAARAREAGEDELAFEEYDRHLARGENLDALGPVLLLATTPQRLQALGRRLAALARLPGAPDEVRATRQPLLDALDALDAARDGVLGPGP